MRRGEDRAAAYQRADLSPELSHERGFGQALLEQRQRVLVVPEAAGTQFANVSGRGAPLRIDGSLAA